MKKIKTENAIGTALCHDVTQIIPGVMKGPIFKKGHIITEADIPTLLDIGKHHVYVYDLNDGYIHENDAADRMAAAVRGSGIKLTDVSEGKISFKAECDGVLKIKREAVLELNSQPEICLAVINPDRAVKADSLLGGCRVIPLAVEKDVIEHFENTAAKFGGSIMEVRPFKPFRIGVVTTGEEIRSGRIKDGFGDVLKTKAAETGSVITKQIFAGDDRTFITQSINELLNSDADMVYVTGGMSVDPDDVTPGAIRDCGGEVITYGAPVLPGAMFMLSYVNGKPVVGLPSCVMYAKRTIYDLIIPRIITGERISRNDIVKLSIGGQCEGCETCRYPQCGFI